MANADYLELLADQIEAQRTVADTKADTKADTGRISLPENNDLLKLAKKLQKEYPKEGTKTDIATDFCGGNKKRAENMLRQLRRYRTFRPVSRERTNSGHAICVRHALFI
ncbi:MAG: hypothetical protein U0935_05825 [Pirellulales bacterium]